MPADLRDALLERARARDRATIELEGAGRTYALLAVDVPEFGFINVYGTDVTAIKERERLAAENERLLLSILPEPIAQRLRDGEPLIADRFDDVTLMFADIVEFTSLSASMSPTELVGVLNDVFSAFDELVEQYGLEKVKTIGDAYLVVGGLPERSTDHTERVASMALDLAAAVGRLETCSSARYPLPRRHRLRAGGGRRHRYQAVHLRRLGGHGQRRQPDGVTRRAGPRPGHASGHGAPGGGVPIRCAWSHRREGQRLDVDLLPGRAGRGHRRYGRREQQPDGQLDRILIIQALSSDEGVPGREVDEVVRDGPQDAAPIVIARMAGDERVRGSLRAGKASLLGGDGHRLRVPIERVERVRVGSIPTVELTERSPSPLGQVRDGEPGRDVRSWVLHRPMRHAGLEEGIGIGEVPIDGQACDPSFLGHGRDRGMGWSLGGVQLDRGLDDPESGLVDLAGPPAHPIGTS